MQDPDEDQGFPVVTFLLIGLGALIGILLIAATFVTAGIGGLVIIALLLIFVGVPMAIHKIKRGVDNPRSLEEERERERAEAEASGVSPKLPIERVRDHRDRTSHSVPHH